MTLFEGGDGDDTLVGGLNGDILTGVAGNDVLIGGAGFEFVRINTFDGVYTIADFATKGSSKDTLSFVRSLFEDFDGDVSDLIGDGFLRAQDEAGDHTKHPG